MLVLIQALATFCKSYHEIKSYGIDQYEKEENYQRTVHFIENRNIFGVQEFTKQSMKYCLKLSVNKSHYRAVLELTGLFLIGPGLYIYFITFVLFHNMIIYNKTYILKINE